MQSIRSASAASAWASPHRCLGQHLAEEDDVRFDRPAAGGAAGDAVAAEERVDRVDPVRGSALAAGRGFDRAVHLDHVLGDPAARWRRSMFWVMTPASRPRRSSSASASWAALGRLSPSEWKRGR